MSPRRWEERTEVSFLFSFQFEIFQQKIQRRLAALRSEDKQEAETELAFQVRLSAGGRRGGSVRGDGSLLPPVEPEAAPHPGGPA